MTRLRNGGFWARGTYPEKMIIDEIKVEMTVNITDLIHEHKEIKNPRKNVNKI